MTPIYPLLILLVEDAPGRVDLLRQALARRRNPANLLVVRNGLEARECLLNRGRFALCSRPDLILLGIDPQRADARGLLRSLQRTQRNRGLAVVALTPDLSGEVIERLRQRGATTVLPRPETLEGFCEVVDQVQGTWRGTKGWPDRAAPPAGPTTVPSSP